MRQTHIKQQTQKVKSVYKAAKPKKIFHLTKLYKERVLQRQRRGCDVHPEWSYDNVTYWYVNVC